ELHPLGLGQSLVVFDVVFPVVGLPSLVSARLGFQDLVFGDLTYMLSFIARRQFHGLLILFRLPILLCSLISLQLSSLLASLVTLPFAMFANPCLDSDFLCMVVSGVKIRLWFLGPYLPFSLFKFVYLVSLLPL
ncbi:hypothetical protein HID58_076059, partial [Brassica napus]